MYYVLQLPASRQLLFNSPSDYEEFERLLRRRLKATHVDALSFAWMPKEVHLIVRVQDVTLGRFMQGLTSSYARYIHRNTALRGHLFAHRYQSILFDPGGWLLELVRYVHLTPVQAGLVSSPEDYSYSSLSAYLNHKRLSWLNITPVVDAAAARGLEGEKLHQFLCTPPSADEREAFEPYGKADARILGDANFRAGLPYAYRSRRARPTLNDIIALVAKARSVPSEEILSPSRAHAPTLARSLIAWHATERRIATLTEVAAALGRDPSSLSKGITRHREQYPTLFVLNVWHHYVPLG
jgi:REP element-mobilizing transposase RayT